MQEDSEIILKNFGSRLQTVRKMKGLSQGGFARILGFNTHNPISLMELGKKEPSIELLCKLFVHMNVDIHWLITGESYPKENPFAEFGEIFYILFDKEIEATSVKIIKLLREKAERAKDLDSSKEDPDKSDSEISMLNKEISELRQKRTDLIDQIEKFNNLCKQANITTPENKMGRQVIVNPLPNNDLRHNGNL